MTRSKDQSKLIITVLVISVIALIVIAQFLDKGSPAVRELMFSKPGELDANAHIKLEMQCSSSYIKTESPIKEGEDIVCNYWFETPKDFEVYQLKIKNLKLDVPGRGTIELFPQTNGTFECTFVKNNNYCSMFTGITAEKSGWFRLRQNAEITANAYRKEIFINRNQYIFETFSKEYLEIRDNSRLVLLLTAILAILGTPVFVKEFFSLNKKS